MRRSLQDLLRDVGPPFPLRPAQSEPSTDTPAPLTLTLDVRRLHLLHVLDERAVGQLIWEPDRAGRRPVCFYAYQDNAIQLHEVLYCTLRRIDTSVEIEWFDPFAYGAKRPWFICPDPRCARRTIKLYVLGTEAAVKCRHCLGMRPKLLRRLELETASLHPLSGTIQRAG